MCQEYRRTFSLYVLPRIFQCIYNGLKSRGWWHFWGSNWNHGDTLLFAIASAQVMYAYVMRPETLPESYYKFILRTGPIDARTLDAVRKINRGKPIDTTSIIEFLSSKVPHKDHSHISSTPDIIGCNLLHPKYESCSYVALLVLLSSAKKILPIYASITIISQLALRFRHLVSNPLQEAKYSILSCFQSSMFLSAFVAIYQAVICVHRNLFSLENKYIYYIAGLFSSMSLLIEKKSRRSELALYALPRGLDSLYMTLLDRKLLTTIPYGDLILFSLSVGGIMYFYDNEKENMSPLLVWGLKKLLGEDDSKEKQKLKETKKQKPESQE